MQAVCERVGRGLRNPYSMLVFLVRPELRRERPPGSRFAQRDQHHGQRPSEGAQTQPCAQYRQARGGKTRCGAGALAGGCSRSESPRVPRTCVEPRNAGVASALSRNGWGWVGKAPGVLQEKRKQEAKDLLMSPARSRPPAGPISIQGLLSPASTPGEYGRTRGGAHSPALSSAGGNAADKSEITPGAG